MSTTYVAIEWEYVVLGRSEAQHVARRGAAASLCGRPIKTAHRTTVPATLDCESCYMLRTWNDAGRPYGGPRRLIARERR